MTGDLLALNPTFPDDIQLTVKLNTNITNAINDERVVKLETEDPHLLQWRNRIGGRYAWGQWGLRLRVTRPP